MSVPADRELMLEQNGSRRRGSHFEALAEAWLKQRGLVPVARNYTCRNGEIDLIMNHGQALVFVEVRYRRSSRYGSAAESVGARKQARLIRAARHYLMRHKWATDHACRFDVMALSGDESNPMIDWIEGAFSA